MGQSVDSAAQERRRQLRRIGAFCGSHRCAHRLRPSLLRPAFTPLLLRRSLRGFNFGLRLAPSSALLLSEIRLHLRQSPLAAQLLTALSATNQAAPVARRSVSRLCRPAFSMPRLPAACLRFSSRIASSLISLTSVNHERTTTNDRAPPDAQSLSSRHRQQLVAAHHPPRRALLLQKVIERGLVNCCFRARFISFALFFAAFSSAAAFTGSIASR